VALSLLVFTGKIHRVFTVWPGYGLEQMGATVSLAGNNLWALAAYLVVPAFLTGSPEAFDRRSRRIILAAFSLYILFSFAFYLFQGKEYISALLSVRSALYWGSRTLILFYGVVMSLGWGLLALMVSIRWWARGRYLVPSIIPLGALCVLLLGLILPVIPVGVERPVYSVLASQMTMIVLSLVLLVRSVPTAAVEEHPDAETSPE
jgi:hypothetical protein